MTTQYRNLVIGSGEGGKVLAWTLAKAGEPTIVVERAMVGGSCPNVACLPSKNVIFSAKAVSLVDPAAGLGVVRGDLHVDMPGVVRRKRAMIAGLAELHRRNFETSGAELVMGEARFVAAKTVEVAARDGGTRRLSGERVFVNVGSRATVPNVPGLVVAAPMTHVEALELERVPAHLVVVGGGYVGLELAQALRRFGSRVTIVQRGPRVLEREDNDVVDALATLLRDEGIDVLTGAELLRVDGRSGSGVRLQVRHADGERLIEASDILVAAGRTPNTDRLDAAKGGIELDGRGYVRVDERLRTTAPDVWAVGDCAGSPQFTHVGFDDFRVVLADLRGGDRTTRGRLIPYCLFTDPELAHVGLHEHEAAAQGVPYRLVRIPAAAVLRTRTLAATRGFVKALIGADDRILGFTAFAAEASEMMAVVQTAMLGGMPSTALRDAIFTHPTAAEGLVTLFASTPLEAAASRARGGS